MTITTTYTKNLTDPTDPKPPERAEVLSFDRLGVKPTR